MTKSKAKAPELVGRLSELESVAACLAVSKNVLLEGPVGVGKTRLALAVAERTRRPIFRVDGDGRYSEQKLTGWFDPPLLVKHGFSAKAFVPGPLVQAMREGGILFLNELNRLPEGVQNVLLPAVDERRITLPKLGEIQARPEFRVIATQNPKEFVATSHLSEALLDRFELIYLDYQSEAEEQGIVADRLGRLRPGGGTAASAAARDRLGRAAVRLARATRDHPRVRRGASVRAAISVAEIAAQLVSVGLSEESAFLTAARVALPTRIELERDADSDRTERAEAESLLADLAREALRDVDSKKKT